MLCSSDPASPECVKYTFTDVSSAALFCSDQATIIEVGLTAMDTAETGLRSSSLVPGGASAPRTAVATSAVRSTYGSGTYTSSYLPPSTTIASSRVVSTSSDAIVVSTSVAAGGENPFTRTQGSGNRVGAIGTATPVAESGACTIGLLRVFQILCCFMSSWAFFSLLTDA